MLTPKGMRRGDDLFAHCTALHFMPCAAFAHTIKQLASASLRWPILFLAQAYTQASRPTFTHLTKEYQCYLPSSFPACTMYHAS